MTKRNRKKKNTKVIHVSEPPMDFYLWNPFKRFFYGLYIGIKDKIRNASFPLSQMIVLGIFLLLIGGLVLFIRANMIVVGERESYNMDGFVHADELAGDIVTLSNGRFTLEFDETTTHFSLHDSLTGHAWNSNVTEHDTHPGITLSSRNAQQNSLVVRYVDDSGVERRLQNYTEAIDRNQFYVRYLDDTSLEVYYEIGNMDIDYTDLPQRLSKERFETLILANIDQEEHPVEYRFVENAYTFVTEHQVYSLNNASSFSQNAINRLYHAIFELTPYTAEDMIEDHLEQGVELPDTKPMIKVAVRYTLTDQGFDARIINESIQESSDYPLSSIDLLPNFGEASIHNKGYLLVPEGSGALIDLNNGQTTREYNRRLFGADDAKVPMSKPTSGEKTAMPVFGMKKDDLAFLAIITEGASMGSIHARVSGSRDSYNRVYPSFNYKESDRIRIPGVTSGEQSQLFRTVWTRFYSESDYTVSYRFTGSDQADYLGMAELYREYLLESGLDPASRSNSLQLNLTLLGGYEKQNHFLGVPYTTVEALTSTEEAERILSALLDEGVTNMNMIYSGWMNGGIEHYLPNDIDTHRSIGRASDLYTLQAFARDNGIELFPEVNFIRPSTDRNLNSSQYTSRTIAGDLAIHYKYNPATLLPNRDTKAEHVLNPGVLSGVIDDFLDEYRTFAFDNIALNDISGRISGSYNNQDFFFRYQAEALQIDAIERLRESSGRTMLRNPLSFALPHADSIIDLPVRGSEFNIIDRSVPFYQLALSGLIDYAGQSFNIYDNRSMDWHKLKAIETGSHLNFTWTYRDTYDLMHTEYNYLYSTQYENWFDIAVTMYHELDALSIHGARLTHHEHIARDIVEVAYDNGTTILINYRGSAFDHEGHTIPSMGYLVTKGDE